MTATRRSALGLIQCFVFLSCACAAQASQQRPLLSEDPRLPPEGVLVTEIGAGYFEDAVFPVSGLGGDQLSLFTGGLHFGLGRAEFQITGTAHNVVWVESGGSGRRNDWGDGVFSTKIAILTEAGRRPDLTFRVRTVLPNASSEKGLGTDGNHFFGDILLGKSAGPAYIFGNVGLGILDDAVDAGSQHDVLTYGVAAILPVGGSLRLAGEVSGLYNAVSTPSRGGEDRGEARVGFRWEALDVEWDAAVTAGMTDVDHRVGVVFGMTKRFTLW
jgi:hypothetical protein